MDLRANQTVWRNTIKTFKNQFTRLDKFIADARNCIKDLSDPDSGVTLKDAKKLIDPISKKLELTNNYVASLHGLLPVAAGEEEDQNYNVDKLTVELNTCMDQVELANAECAGFCEAINNAEERARKESKPERSGHSPREERTPEIKGVATALKPDELTTSVAAQDISLWMEQWQ